jgi:uridine kinase
MAEIKESKSLDNKVEEKEIPKEIERKYLVAKLPENLDTYPKKEIVQGYLAIASDGTEVRLRKKGDKYYQTVKIGSGKTRGEFETEITGEQFEKLWQATEGKRIEKIRYEIPQGDNIIELDIYQGDLIGLVSVEVEFKSEFDSEKFSAPEWFGGEVTEDSRYKNKNLALHGIPKEEKIKKSEEKESLGIPEYSLEKGVGILVDMIKEKISEAGDSSVVVEIAGGSASGKTSAVAKKVCDVFSSEAVLISMDDYYRGKAFIESEKEKGNILNWDQPEALNIALLSEHIRELKNGNSIEKPVYDFKTGEPSGTEEIKPKKIIIIEGLFALNEMVKDQGDVRGFVDIGMHGRILRRILRDVERTGQKPEDILNYFSDIVEPMHEKYIETTKKNSDIVIKNEYSPEIEAERSGMHEIQLKFRGTIDQNFLRQLGAEKLGIAKQIDVYYNPKDRNLVDTGEILRIREEEGHQILTYKGPKKQSEFRDRPKFEFEIDKEVADKFIALYGDKVKVISKERALYQLNGVVFSLDSVIREEGGEKKDLGKFIEFRSTDQTDGENKIKEVVSKINLEMENGIKESYFDM